MELKEHLTKALHNAEFLKNDLLAACKLLEKQAGPVAWIAACKLKEHYEYVQKLAFDLAAVEGE